MKDTLPGMIAYGPRGTPFASSDLIAFAAYPADHQGHEATGIRSNATIGLVPPMEVSSKPSTTWRLVDLSPSPERTANAPEPELIHERLVAPICYEVVRVVDGKVLCLQEHLDRLHDSLVAMFQLSADDATWYIEQEIKPVCRQLLDSNLSFRSNVKIVVWLSARDTEHQRRSDSSEAEVEALGDESALAVSRIAQLNSAAQVIKSFYPPESWYETGAVLGVLLNATRHDPNAKAIQAEVRGRAVAMQTEFECFEVLLCGPAPTFYVPEGSRSNYIAITASGTVLSSPDQDILIGITLGIVKRICRDELNIPFLQRKISLRELLLDAVSNGAQKGGGGKDTPSTSVGGGTAENGDRIVALAMTGTSVGVLPIRALRFCGEEWARLSGEPADSLPGTEVQDRPYREITFASTENEVLRRLVVKYNEAARAHVR